MVWTGVVWLEQATKKRFFLLGSGVKIKDDDNWGVETVPQR